MENRKIIEIGEILEKANTGLDAIKRAPIVEYDSGIKCLRIQDVSQSKKFEDWGFTEVSENNFGKFQLKKGDIIVARTGATIGVNRFINEDINAVFNNGLIKLKVNENKCLPKYLFYNLQSYNYWGYIDGISGGTSTQPNMQINALLKYEIQLPPLPEQKAIASVLSSLDDKIDLLHQQNQTLEALAETLFRQWFIERCPEPVEGEAKEDWEELPFSEWINETVGGDWGKETLQDEFTKEVYCIRGTDIADLLIGIPTKTPIRFVKEKKFQSIEPKEGDIIIEISGGTENQSTGRAYFINNEIKSLFGKDLVFSNFCRLIRIKDSNYSFFVYLYLKYLYDQDEFFNLENGSSGIKNLDYKSLLFENKYKMPKEDLVLKFNDQVSNNYKKINQNKFQIQTLTKLRDTLLPKLMSGEVRVKI
ncbi:restriction endonuclease subunit S [Flavobacterium sp.]|uniref:restriction endonuclease subunit S n=1 Tax=Flavobacterium sp. TaxID=239 RepID=UPI0035AD8B2D